MASAGGAWRRARRFRAPTAAGSGIRECIYETAHLGWSASSRVTTANGTNYLNLTSPTGRLFFRLTISELNRRQGPLRRGPRLRRRAARSARSLLLSHLSFKHQIQSNLPGYVLTACTRSVSFGSFGRSVWTARPQSECGPKITWTLVSNLGPAGRQHGLALPIGRWCYRPKRRVCPRQPRRWRRSAGPIGIPSMPTFGAGAMPRQRRRT